jgi:hypothetical protein
MKEIIPRLGKYASGSIPNDPVSKYDHNLLLEREREREMGG